MRYINLDVLSRQSREGKFRKYQKIMRDKKINKMEAMKKLLVSIDISLKLKNIIIARGKESQTDNLLLVLIVLRL